MMGPYMEPIPALGSVAMIFSLFAAFIFTPWLAQRIRPSMKALAQSRGERAPPERSCSTASSSRLLVPLITKPVDGWAFAVGLLAVFFLSARPVLHHRR